MHDTAGRIKERLVSENLYQELNYSLLYIHNTLEKLSKQYSGVLLLQLHEEYDCALNTLNLVSKQAESMDVEKFDSIRLVLAAVAEYSLSPVQAPAISQLLMTQLNCLISIERRQSEGSVC